MHFLDRLSHPIFYLLRTVHVYIHITSNDNLRGAATVQETVELSVVQGKPATEMCSLPQLHSPDLLLYCPYFVSRLARHSALFPSSLSRRAVSLIVESSLNGTRRALGQCLIGSGKKYDISCNMSARNQIRPLAHAAFGTGGMRLRWHWRKSKSGASSLTEERMQMRHWHGPRQGCRVVGFSVEH
jgi:hypothetical protein